MTILLTTISPKDWKDLDLYRDPIDDSGTSWWFGYSLDSDYFYFRIMGIEVTVSW